MEFADLPQHHGGRASAGGGQHHRLKPSEVTPASAIEIAQLAIEAGIPEGVINVVTGLRETGEALVDHPLVRKVSFVGSVGVGREIGARAGRRLITSTLELGGKSPNIVFGDADLDLAEIGVLAGILPRPAKPASREAAPTFIRPSMTR